MDDKNYRKHGLTFRSTLISRRSLAPAVVVAGLLCAVFAACGTTKPLRQTDRGFLGDFDPIRLEDVMALRIFFGKIKPAIIRLYFVPRTNVVEAHLRDGMNTIALMFDENARNTIGQAITLYAAAYAAYADADVSAMAERKPTKKNAFNTGKLSLSWGVASAARNCETVFRTNYEFLEKGKPYFLLTAEPANDNEDSSVQSPELNLYFSPTQLEALCAVSEQKTLQQQVDELNEKAFAF